MEKKQKEIEKLLLEHEKEAFDELKKSYNRAMSDIKGRILNLQNKLNELNEIDTTGYDDRSLEILQSMKQSKIYQLNYQKALEEQVGACIEVLKQDTVTNIQTYLDRTYKDSYLGSLYNINAKGIPVTTPINPSLLSRTVNKKIDGMTFSQRVGHNMNDFKKTVKSEISRGIANGSSYNDIAKQLSMRTGEDLYKSQRIIRTEGGRVSTEARLTSIRDAKEKGADLVKQWDSTLDGKTRPMHIRLDGQIAEVDEPFKVDGVEVMGPGMFGDPGEDCNCRCVVLSIPRWDIEDTVVKYDNENDELIETKNYQEWKQGYYRRIADEELQEKITKAFVKATTREEVIDRIKNAIGSTSVDLGRMNISIANDYLEGIETFANTFPEVKGYVRVVNTKAGTNLGVFNPGDLYYKKDGKTRINQYGTVSIRNTQNPQRLRELYDYGIKIKFQYEGHSPKSTAAHEMTHALEHLMYMKLNNLTPITEKNLPLYEWKDGKAFYNHSIAEEIINQAKEELYNDNITPEIYKNEILYLGKYAMGRPGEHFAQAISYELTVGSRPYSAKILELFKKKVKEVFKK